jgi:hypothetical protein
VVTFGGFIGFGSTTVQLGADEVSFYRDASDSVVVRTDLTTEAFEERPEYEG